MMIKLFVHMPKCAGISVRGLLDACSPQPVERDYDSFFKIPREDRNLILTKCLLEPKEMKIDSVIYGHFFPIKYIGPNNHNRHKLVTILRDPLSRLESHYKYWNNNEFPDHYLWRNMKRENWSFEEFAFRDEMRNIYAQHFSGIGFSDFTYIGLFEDLNASVMQCLLALGIDFDPNVTIPKENVASPSEPLILSQDLARKLRNHHADDYLIYEFAKRKFHRPQAEGADGRKPGDRRMIEFASESPTSGGAKTDQSKRASLASRLASGLFSKRS